MEEIFSTKIFSNKISRFITFGDFYSGQKSIKTDK